MSKLLLALALTPAAAFVGPAAASKATSLASEPESRYDFKEGFCLDLPGAAPAFYGFFFFASSDRGAGGCGRRRRFRPNRNVRRRVALRG